MQKCVLLLGFVFLFGHAVSEEISDCPVQDFQLQPGELRELTLTQGTSQRSCSFNINRAGFFYEITNLAFPDASDEIPLCLLNQLGSTLEYCPSKNSGFTVVQKLGTSGSTANNFAVNMTFSPYPNVTMSPWITYAGCYSVYSGQTYKAVNISSNSAEHCQLHCLQGDWFALKNNTCYCLTHDAQLLSPNGTCDITCNNTAVYEICGGSKAISLYRRLFFLQDLSLPGQDCVSVLCKHQNSTDTTLRTSSCNENRPSICLSENSSLVSFQNTSLDWSDSQQACKRYSGGRLLFTFPEGKPCSKYYSQLQTENWISIFRARITLPVSGTSGRNIYNTSSYSTHCFNITLHPMIPTTDMTSEETQQTTPMFHGVSVDTSVIPEQTGQQFTSTQSSHHDYKAPVSSIRNAVTTDVRKISSQPVQNQLTTGISSKHTTTKDITVSNTKTDSVFHSSNVNKTPISMTSSKQSTSGIVSNTQVPSTRTASKTIPDIYGTVRNIHSTTEIPGHTEQSFSTAQMTTKHHDHLILGSSIKNDRTIVMAKMSSQKTTNILTTNLYETSKLDATVGSLPTVERQTESPISSTKTAVITTPSSIYETPIATVTPSDVTQSHVSELEETSMVYVSTSHSLNQKGSYATVKQFGTLSAGAITGIIIGCLSAVAVVTVLVVFKWKKAHLAQCMRKRRQSVSPVESGESFNSDTRNEDVQGIE